MRFKGDTVTCESCGIEINEDDDHRHPDADEHCCPVCATRAYNNWLKEECQICKKPMGDEPSDAFYNFNSDSAHKSCVDKLSDEEIEESEWCNEY